MKKTDSQEQNVNGIIEADKFYTMPAFRAITGKGRHAINESKKRGLRIRKDGRTPYIYGQDYIEYVLKTDDRKNRSVINNRLNPN